MISSMATMAGYIVISRLITLFIDICGAIIKHRKAKR